MIKYFYIVHFSFTLYNDFVCMCDFAASSNECFQEEYV